MVGQRKIGERHQGCEGNLLSLNHYRLRSAAVLAIKIPAINRNSERMPQVARIVIYFRMIVKFAE